MSEVHIMVRGPQGGLVRFNVPDNGGGSSAQVEGTALDLAAKKVKTGVTGFSTWKNPA